MDQLTFFEEGKKLLNLREASEWVSHTPIPLNEILRGNKNHGRR